VLEVTAPPFEVPEVTDATPSFARTYARNLLIKESVVSEKTIDAIVLIVSELVTNVVRHAGGRVRLEIELHDGGVIVVRCTDSSTTQTDPADSYGTERESGYGLLLVSRLAHSVAEIPLPDGKTIVAIVDPTRLAKA